MLLLAIDTATPAVTAGVVSLDSSGALTLAERTTVNPRAHGELCTPHVRDVVAAAGVRLPDVDVIVCGHGPGPYTGLRAGMVTAAALGHALNIAVYPVGSLDAIAAEVTADEPFLVVSDARRREVYWAEYQPPPSDGALLHSSALTGPGVVRPGELSTGCRVAAGHGAVLYSDTLGVSTVEPSYPSSRGLALVAAPDVLAEAEPAQLAPLYLRKPHAAEPGSPKRVSA